MSVKKKFKIGTEGFKHTKQLVFTTKHESSTKYLDHPRKRIVYVET